MSSLSPLSLPNLPLSDIIERFGVQGFTFDSGSGSVEVPSGAFWVIIKLWGGGGGGGGRDTTNNWPGSGGGGGAFVAQWGAVSPGNTIAYAVGSGGGGGNDRTIEQGLEAGSSGGNTTCTTFGLVAGGGGGGAAGFPGEGGAGGTASGGLVNTGGGGGSAPEEPGGAGGIGGPAISEGSFWYDGGELAAGAGGNGGAAGGDAKGDDGESGLVRIIFLGDFGLPRNLRSYYRTTTSQSVTTPVIVVPGFNTGVTDNVNADISITDFNGANADFGAGTPDNPPDPSPPPENDVLITLDTTDPSALTVDPSGPTLFPANTQVQVTLTAAVADAFPSVQLNNCGVANPSIGGSGTTYTATFTTPAAGTSCLIRFQPGTPPPPPGNGQPQST